MIEEQTLTNEIKEENTNKSMSKEDDSSFSLAKNETNPPVLTEQKQVVTLNSTKDEIVKRMQETSSIDELKDLTNLFGISLTKREIIRASKESDLMDKLLEQAEERIVEKGDYLSNADLLDFMKTLQSNVDKSRKTFNDDIDNASTKITNTHNEININVNDSVTNLSRESREKVLDLMKVLFANIQEEQQDLSEPQEVDIVKEENNKDD